MIKLLKIRRILNTVALALILSFVITSAWAQAEYGDIVQTMTDRNQYNGLDYNGSQTTSLTPTDGSADRYTYKGMDANGTITDVKNVGKLYEDMGKKNTCSLDVIQKEYLDKSNTNYCWYCNITSTMTNAYLSAVAECTGVVQTLALLILHYGFLIWLAYYILQQVSSLAPTSTGKMLQEILMMGFKVLLAGLAVRQGVPLLTEYFLDPVMLLGIDYGQEMLDGITSANISSTSDIARANGAGGAASFGGGGGIISGSTGSGVR
jgi:hypothetical protein